MFYDGRSGQSGTRQRGLPGGGVGLSLDWVHSTGLHIANEVTYTNDCKQRMQERWPDGGMPASPLTDLSLPLSSLAVPSYSDLTVYS